MIDVFENSVMKPKCSKPWDMKYHWLRDKEVFEQLRVYWVIGINNDTDCFTKDHPPIHHFQMRPQYIHTFHLVRKKVHTISLCKGVLKLFPADYSRVDSLT